MQPHLIKQAAQILYDARRQRRQIKELPIECRPRTLADGYAVQKEVIRLIDDPVIGWKVGCTTKESQERSETTEPFSGPVLQRDLYCHGSEVPLDAYFTCALQVEFAFRIVKDLPAKDAPFSINQVRAAIGAVLPALEIADSRFVNSSTISAPSLIADAGKAGVLIVGEGEAELDRIDIAEQEVTLHVNGRLVARGQGKNVMGDPVKSLHWLANDMAMRGEDLTVGQIISSGTCTGSFMAKPGDRVIANYGSLGNVEVRLGL